MKKIFGAVAVAALALTGCGNLCEDMSEALVSSAEKSQSCPSSDPDETLPGGFKFTDAQINKCSEAIDKSCTSDDKKVIENAVDCLNDLPKCTAANEKSFQTSYGVCILGAIGVSEACGNALGASIQ